MSNRIFFTAAEIKKLRESAQEADNPLALLAQFSSLSLKEGFSLFATSTPYIFEGQVGYIWAIPTQLSPPDIENCEKIDLWDLPRPFPIDNSCLDGISEPGSKIIPQPRGALKNLMDAIQGDGTPWSYIQASIFAREAAEFGAFWHGIVWSTHTILRGAPWSCHHDWPEVEERLSPEQNWHWLDSKPSEWRPSVLIEDKVITVQFYTYSGMLQESIYRFTDTYVHNSYKFDWSVEITAESKWGSGYIF